MFHAGYWPPLSQKGRSLLSSVCRAVEATPGTALHAWMISARFSEESMFTIAREKCTILQPRATDNPQIPIIAIAVQKRISARIATNPSSIAYIGRTPSIRICIFIVLLLHRILRLAVVDQIGNNARHFLILERQSRTLGLSHTRP